MNTDEIRARVFIRVNKTKSRRILLARRAELFRELREIERLLELNFLTETLLNESKYDV